MRALSTGLSSLSNSSPIQHGQPHRDPLQPVHDPPPPEGDPESPQEPVPGALGRGPLHSSY